MKKKKIVIGLVVLVLVFVAVVLAVRLISPEDKVGLPNPASVHCEEVGGTLDIRTGEDGGQVGYCIFPDKTECEEWALLRNECVDKPVVVSPAPTNVNNFRNLSIKEGDVVTSPIEITGEVVGNWSFEATFPVVLVDWDGRIIAEAPARLLGNWMTGDFVKFKAELKFTKPANPTNQDYASKGAIIFRKDNPSGLPKNDRAYELPIRF